MIGGELTFSIFGTTCVVSLPEALDGAPPANDTDDAAPPTKPSGIYPLAAPIEDDLDETSRR